MSVKNCVHLRPMQIQDTNYGVRILQNDLVKKTYMVPDMDNEAAKKLFFRLMDLSCDENHYVRGIYLQDRLIGWINDTEINDSGIELGWVIDPEFHNCGYATEAVKTAIADLFQKGWKSVLAGAFTENLASIRVMEKAGTQCLNIHEQIEYRGQLHMCVYYESRNE